MNESIPSAKRTLRKKIRLVERKSKALERDVEKQTRMAKNLAKKGGPEACMAIAKEIARSRKVISVLKNSIVELQSIEHSLNEIAVYEKMGSSLQCATQSMRSLNQQMDITSLNKNISEFSHELIRSSVTEEIISTRLNDVMADFSEEDEVAGSEVTKIIAELLSEASINAKAAIEKQSANTQQIPIKSTVSSVAQEDDHPDDYTDMEKRLENLKAQ